MRTDRGEGEARRHCRQLGNDTLFGPPPYWSIKYTPWRRHYTDRGPPSVILSTPQAEAPVAWLGGLPGPHPSWAAASIPPQLSHWLGGGLPPRPCPLLWLPPICPSTLKCWLLRQVHSWGAVGVYEVTSHPRDTRVEARESLAGREDICKNN